MLIKIRKVTRHFIHILFTHMFEFLNFLDDGCNCMDLTIIFCKKIKSINQFNNNNIYCAKKKTIPKCTKCRVSVQNTQTKFVENSTSNTSN
jgi:hypothetical protein